MARACPRRASELRLAPRPFLCTRGKASGSRDFKRIWVIQTGCGRRSASANEKHVASVSPSAGWLAQGFQAAGGGCGGEARLDPENTQPGAEMQIL